MLLTCLLDKELERILFMFPFLQIGMSRLLTAGPCLHFNKVKAHVNIWEIEAGGGEFGGTLKVSVVEAPLETENVKGDESVCMVQRQRQVNGVNQDLPILGLQRMKEEITWNMHY